MVAPIDAQTSRCGHIVIQDQPPDRVPQMSHLVRSHFHHRSLGAWIFDSVETTNEQATSKDDFEAKLKEGYNMLKNVRPSH
uniref:Uncharacterized protein n=1 Tax=Angiostrongylus cantonensis TaxID=6313 RepID=A0A0K0DRV4_ANGCA